MNENDVVGIPALDGVTSYDIAQGYGDTCAIRCQQLILKDFGIDVFQEQLIGEAKEHGWYVKHGTPPNAVGNLLELHGVGVSRYRDASIADLTKALAEGKKVIVGVDAHELMGHVPLDASASDHTANHALIVAGIDTHDPGDVRVILTDPGTGHIAQSYPIDTFNAVWHDSHNMMIVTNDPVPGLPNFDETSGHITGSISGLSYDEWCHQHSDEFTQPYQIGNDLNVDGIIDTWIVDGNDDGTYEEIRIDMDGNGIDDCRGIDNDEDGVLDVCKIDTDGDGVMDVDMTIEMA